jgi:hypothetical protein
MMESETMDEMDLSEMTKTLAVLEAVLVHIEQWIVIQRSNFDFTLSDEPYQASQILFNKVSRDYVVRVWGRTYR